MSNVDIALLQSNEGKYRLKEFKKVRLIAACTLFNINYIQTCKHLRWPHIIYVQAVAHCASWIHSASFFRIKTHRNKPINDNSNRRPSPKIHFRWSLPNLLQKSFSIIHGGNLLMSRTSFPPPQQILFFETFITPPNKSTWAHFVWVVISLLTRWTLFQYLVNKQHDKSSFTNTIHQQLVCIVRQVRVATGFPFYFRM